MDWTLADQTRVLTYLANNFKMAQITTGLDKNNPMNGVLEKKELEKIRQSWETDGIDKILTLKGTSRETALNILDYIIDHETVYTFAFIDRDRKADEKEEAYFQALQKLNNGTRHNIVQSPKGTASLYGLTQNDLFKMIYDTQQNFYLKTQSDNIQQYHQTESNTVYSPYFKDYDFDNVVEELRVSKGAPNLWNQGWMMLKSVM